jgi:hypothetical protein
MPEGVQISLYASSLTISVPVTLAFSAASSAAAGAQEQGHGEFSSGAALPPCLADDFPPALLHDNKTAAAAADHALLSADHRRPSDTITTEIAAIRRPCGLIVDSRTDPEASLSGVEHVRRSF